MCFASLMAVWPPNCTTQASGFAVAMMLSTQMCIRDRAAEFDYSGTQACRALKAEGIETVLLNSNPATIMTDPDVADHVYIEPMTLEVVERILDIEKPDSVLPNRCV